MSQTMLYKYPGRHDIHGDHFDYTSVEDDKVDEALADGWHLTTPAAKQAHADLVAAQAAERERINEEAAAKALADSNAPPTRAELEEMATNLGLPFTARTGDKKLADMIKAATEPAAQAAEPAQEQGQASPDEQV